MAQETDKDRTRQESVSDVPYPDWLAAYRAGLERDRTRLRALETRWSWVRLITFAAGVALVVLLRHSFILAGAAGILGLLAFAAAVLQHTKWQDRRSFVERALIVSGESLHASTRRDGPARTWRRPDDPQEASAVLPAVLDAGPVWPLTDQERDDLDLYGPPVGIFGLLNHTSTLPGARRLRDMLDAPSLSREHLRQRQEAVRWLAFHREQRLGMMATLALLRGHDRHLDRLIQLLHQTEPPGPSLASKAIRLWSVLSGLIFLYVLLHIVGGQLAWIRPLLGLLLINNTILVLARPMFRRLDALVSPWTTLRSTLSHFLAVARHAGQDLPDQTQLGILKEHSRKIVAETHIPGLCEWLEWAGLHGIARGVLNMLVFFDLHIAESVLAHVVPNREMLLHGLSAMTELEALCSLAGFCAELPVACYPQPDAGRGLHIEDGRHPLLLEQDAVPNSVHLDPDTRTWVITGPNAAGKSTFLRMVGVNVLLAQIGTAAAAKRMTWSPVRLITDVRIRDDLARHESYFLSEVRRLRRLVLDADPVTPLLGLIDEPFRGTNSQERTVAGVALLEHLMASSGLFVVATHEETLARTAAGAASAGNYHFQEHLRDGGIEFDYLLRPGPAGTKTALRILEREGYPQTLLERARGLMPPES